jgi:hypothetical protein
MTVFKVGSYLVALILDQTGDIRLLVSTTTTMLIGKRMGDHEGFADLGYILFSKQEDRQPTDLEQKFSIRKAKTNTSLRRQGDKLTVNVLGKTILAFDFEW